MTNYGQAGRTERRALQSPGAGACLSGAGGSKDERQI